MEYLKKEYKPLLVITILFLINVILFNHKIIDVMVDFGNEIFYTKEILGGSVLYKDIYVPFGPFSYLFNALLVKFFGANLNTFYFAGAINAYLISIFLYAISRYFLDKKISCLITIYVIYNCLFVPHLMNYLMPYSYSVVYGLSACLSSLLLFFSYLKTNKNPALYFSFFFAGMAAANKYEFILFGPVLFVFLLIKKYKEYHGIPAF